MHSHVYNGTISSKLSLGLSAGVHFPKQKLFGVRARLMRRRRFYIATPPHWLSPYSTSSKYADVHSHDDVIKWKHFPRYWPFVRGIHKSPVNSPHKGQWRGALMFSLICARINGLVNTREAGDLRRHHTHCDVIVMPRLNWQRSGTRAGKAACRFCAKLVSELMLTAVVSTQSSFKSYGS